MGIWTNYYSCYHYYIFEQLDGTYLSKSLNLVYHYHYYYINITMTLLHNFNSYNSFIFSFRKFI